MSLRVGASASKRFRCPVEHPSARSHVESAAESFREHEEVTSWVRILPIAALAAETTVEADNFN
jgi:hypothetical protein